MHGKIAFCILSGPYTFQATNTLVGLANAALAKGHEITGIFFFVDGVYNVNKRIKVEAGSLDLPAELKQLADKGVKMAACSACAEYRGISEGDLVPGAELAGLATFGEYFEAADKVVVLGM
ncbi:MAG: DsrE/DsrF/TusD sulfur relay family protein [Candidatus Sigynarchaeota archaeon]